MGTEAPIVHIEKLSKEFRDGFWLNRRVQAVKDLDLSINRGEVFGLVGPNGAGKSTTIKMLMNLMRPSSGSVKVMGLNPGHVDATRRIGFCPENPAPYGYLTGLEFLRFSGQLAGLKGAELDRRVAEVLAEVGLTRSAHLGVRKFSKGMVQRLALAQAVLSTPELLVLDEPTSGLDPVGRKQVRDLVLAQKQRGVTVLLCTHIIPDVEATCDRFAIMVGGKVRQSGAVAECVASDGATSVVAAGLSKEAISVAEGNPVGDRLQFKVETQALDALLREVLAKGGKILQVTPASSPLEAAFLKAVHEAGVSVGAETIR